MESNRLERAVSLMKEWLSKRSFHYLENVRIRGFSGRIHEIDLLVFTEKGPVPVLVIGSRISKASLAKVESLVKDIGVRAAALLVGDASSEELNAATSAGVEVFTPRSLELLVSLANSNMDTVFLVPDPKLLEKSGKLVESRCASRIRRILGKPRVEDGKCVYAPIYACNVVAESSRHAFIALSGLTGGILYVEKGVIREGLLRALGLPDDLKELYSKLRGKRIPKTDFVRVWGRKAWNRFLNEASTLGLADLEKGIELRVVDDAPKVEAAEAAAEELLAPATRSPASECSVTLPLISPGKAASRLYKLTGWTLTSYSLIMAPIYAARVEGEPCGITLWRGGPLIYKPLPGILVELQG